MTIGPFTGEYRLLSNFARFEVYRGGLWYPTAEHAFQAAKTLDEHERSIIRDASSPKEAKRIGRAVDLRPDWELIKVSTMFEIVQSKFSRKSPAQEVLLSTGYVPLVEYNTWHDNFWGDCTCSRCELTRGENMLGVLLNVVRAELRRHAA